MAAHPLESHRRSTNFAGFARTYQPEIRSRRRNRRISSKLSLPARPSASRYGLVAPLYGQTGAGATSLNTSVAPTRSAGGARRSIASGKSRREEGVDRLHDRIPDLGAPGIRRHL